MFRYNKKTFIFGSYFIELKVKYFISQILKVQNIVPLNVRLKAPDYESNYNINITKEYKKLF